MSEVHSLQRQIAELSSKIARLDAPQSNYLREEPTNNWRQPPCFWECVIQSSGTFTPGTDWYSQFDPNPTITNQVLYREATAGGELMSGNPNGGATMGARRCILQVYAENPQTIRAAGSFTGSTSRVQFTVNGNMTEVSAGGGGGYSDYFTFNLVRGYNTIVICTNTAVDDLNFYARIFDGRTVFWVDPSAPKNPQYQAFLAGSSGGFSGSSAGQVSESGSGGMGVGSE